MNKLQLTSLHQDYDTLQIKYGGKDLKAIYGAGRTENPAVMFVFMNPTAKNISADPNWKGLRAPWLGTKTVWDIFESLSILSNKTYKIIREKTPNEWNSKFSQQIYDELASNGAFITNFAKCTLPDARPLSNSVYRNYHGLMLKEIKLTNPQKIITFGNQVSSLLLNKQVSVSDYDKGAVEQIKVAEDIFNVYPVYYPVGQGRRNLPLALKRLKYIIKK